VTFDGLAQQAFSKGREREALQYLNAWALSSDAGASEVLSGIQWVPALRRPTMAVRWGVGIQLTAPPRFSGDAKPIGSTQAFGTGRERRPGGGNPGEPGSPEGGFAGGNLGYEGGAGGGGGRNNAVSQYAGEFGSMVLERFQARVSSGKFGKALKNASSGPTGGGGGAEGYAGSGAYPGAGADVDAEGSLGAPGLSGGAAPGAAPPGYGAGRGMPPGSSSGPGRGGAGSAGDGAVLSTGLTLLGVGNDKELREKALEAHVDVLAIFKVKLSVNRANFVNNDTEIVLVDPVKGKELFNSATLNNIKVQKDREQNKDDGVEKEVKKMFEYIDQDLTVTSLPSILTPEIVKNSRVQGKLLTGEIVDPLAVLTEIRFYNRNKLLADDDMAAAFVKVAGAEDAKTLLEGSEEERKKVVEKWLPQG
jgi:hypothetical protein